MRERRSRWHKNGHDARGPWTALMRTTILTATVLLSGLDEVSKEKRKREKGMGYFEGHTELDPIGSKGHWIRGAKASEVRHQYQTLLCIIEVIITFYKKNSELFLRDKV